MKLKGEIGNSHEELSKAYLLKNLKYIHVAKMLGKKLFFATVFLSFMLCSTLLTSASTSTIWSQAYGGAANDYAYSIVEVPDGGYAMAGYTNSFGAVGDDFWLAKTDALGNMQWNKTYGGSYADRAYSLVATSD